MYLYSGYDLFYHPTSWIWAVPQWFSRAVTTMITIETYLSIQGIGELIIGLLFLAWFSGKWGVVVGSVYAAAEFFLILIFVGIDPITFRDIGLLGAALALLIIALFQIPPKETPVEIVQSK